MNLIKLCWEKSSHPEKMRDLLKYYFKPNLSKMANQSIQYHRVPLFSQIYAVYIADLR